jgi:hypothetical protein
MSDCREILKSTEYENLTIPCNQSASNLNSLLSQYTDERMLGGSGEEFLGQIALALVK